LPRVHQDKFDLTFSGSRTETSSPQTRLDVTTTRVSASRGPPSVRGPDDRFGRLADVPRRLWLRHGCLFLAVHSQQHKLLIRSNPPAPAPLSIAQKCALARCLLPKRPCVKFPSAPATSHVSRSGLQSRERTSYMPLFLACRRGLPRGQSRPVGSSA